jgi:hypothetical protein
MLPALCARNPIQQAKLMGTYRLFSVEAGSQDAFIRSGLVSFRRYGGSFMVLLLKKAIALEN